MQYVLKKPVKLGEQGETVTALTLRDEVCAGDMRGITMRTELDYGDAIKLISRLSGQPEALVNKLHFADFSELAVVVVGFLNAGPATGS